MPNVMHVLVVHVSYMYIQVCTNITSTISLKLKKQDNPIFHEEECS